MLLSQERSQLLVVDVQERLAPAMNELDKMVANARKLIRAARELAIPITVSEQYPKGLGATLPAIVEDLAGAAEIIPKLTFSCGKDEALRRRLLDIDRDQIVICGIEAHVCVLQSAFDLAGAGRHCFVVADAIASRHRESKDIALRRMERARIASVTTEMAIFEWLQRAGTLAFKALAPILKD